MAGHFSVRSSYLSCVASIMAYPRLHRKTLTAVLPCVLCAKYFNDGAKAGKVFEGVAAEDFDAMVWDSTASHVVEVVLQVRGERSVGKFGEKCHQAWFGGMLGS